MKQAQYQTLIETKIESFYKVVTLLHMGEVEQFT